MVFLCGKILKQALYMIQTVKLYQKQRVTKGIGKLRFIILMTTKEI